MRTLYRKIFDSSFHFKRRNRLRLFFFWLVLLPVAGPAEEWQTHTVSRGENLTVIARRYDVTIEDLQEWNDLKDDRLLVGQQLRLSKQNNEWYVVKSGDNLSRIAARFDTTVSSIRQLNRLSGSRIYPGQKLRILPAPANEAVYVVEKGDTLTEIARRFNTSIAELKRINGLSRDRIFVGQQLSLREADMTSHIVERGDALWEIARTYGMKLSELKRINQLTGDRIYPGQVLKVTAPPENGSGTGTTEVKLATYVVERGDNLNDIARLHQMSLSELQDLNSLSGSLIYPGQKLQVRPLLGTYVDNGNYIGSLDWSKFMISVPGIASVTADNGPYFYEKPRAIRQLEKSYVEDSPISPLVSYRHARKLFDAYEDQVKAQGRLDNRLKGWHFVLDPGHGGIDPGAIVPGEDEDGKKYYIVEDEYCYDLALRVYTLLKAHGADVTLTVLAANHLLRTNTPVSSTFVHDRNEIFNDEEWNRRNRPATWPKGGQSYLEKRVEIARKAVKDTAKDRQVFLSFHADNEKSIGNATTLFYHQNTRSVDRVSRDFARKLLPAMGAGSRAKGRNYSVLRNNPIRYKLLVEMRNLAFADHIWAIRYEQLRQRDAEKMVEALVSVLGTEDVSTAGASPEPPVEKVQ